MGKKNDRKLSKDKNKEGVSSLLKNVSLKYDCLEDVELNSKQCISVDFEDAHKERKKKRKVVEVDDIDEECLKGKKMERRSKGDEEKVISQEPGIGEEQDLDWRVPDENEGGSNSVNKKKKNYGKVKEDGEDVGLDGGVNAEMNGVFEDDMEVKKSKRKREKMNDVVDNDVGDGKGKHSPSIEKESKVQKKNHKFDLFTGNEDESYGTRCNESKRVGGIDSIDSEGNKQGAESDMGENGKIKKKKKKNKIELTQEKVCSEELPAEGKSTQVVESLEIGGNTEKSKSKKSKMRKGNKHVSEGKECNEVSQDGKGIETSDHSSKLKSKKKSKRVSFSDEIEVLDLVRGKRYTKEEDEKIIDSVHSYIQSNRLGDNGMKMILHCRMYPEVRNCWKDIASVLPHRPRYSVYERAHTLLERAEDRKWAPEERELVRRFYEKHGADWKMLADALGKHRKHVKDYWRRNKFDPKPKCWSQEEYQTLFDLVNQDLRMRALEENRKRKHGMLRDNIPWESISDILTRTHITCCQKWYLQLTSPMVVSGTWSDTDDYRLVNALYELDAASMEEVEWDFLLEHRTGDICRKRWNQMVRHIGDHGNKSFAEQVEVISKRYCPHLIEEREVFDSKPEVV